MIVSNVTLRGAGPIFVERSYKIRSATGSVNFDTLEDTQNESGRGNEMLMAVTGCVGVRQFILRAIL